MKNTTTYNYTINNTATCEHFKKYSDYTVDRVMTCDSCPMNMNGKGDEVEGYYGCVKTQYGVEFINLTPHDLVIIKDDGDTVTIASTGEPARVSAKITDVDEIGGITIGQQSFGDVTGLPAPQDGVVYIVSALVANAVNRADVLYPADFVRNDKGQVVGARRLARV